MKRKSSTSKCTGGVLTELAEKSECKLHMTQMALEIKLQLQSIQEGLEVSQKKTDPARARAA